MSPDPRSEEREARQVESSASIHRLFLAQPNKSSDQPLRPIFVIRNEMPLGKAGLSTVLVYTLVPSASLRGLMFPSVAPSFRRLSE